MRAVQGKTDGEQWKEMGRRWRGSERRQSFWRVETVQKLISDVGRKSGKSTTCQQHFKNKFAKVVARLQPTFEKLLSKIGGKSKRKAQKET